MAYICVFFVFLYVYVFFSERERESYLPHLSAAFWMCVCVMCVCLSVCGACALLQGGEDA